MQASSYAKLLGAYRMGTLREAAHPEGKKGLWLSKYLDDEQLAEIYVRVFQEGEELKDIARIVRDVWGIQKHWDLKDFVKGLAKWKRRLDSMISETEALQGNEKGKKEVQKAKKKLQDCFAKVDALGRLGFAIDVQTQRLLWAHEREKQHSLPMKLTDDIQSNLAAMCKDYIQMAIKTGAIDGVAAEVNVNLHAESELVLKHVVGNEGNKMVKTARDFLRSAVAQCIPMELNQETGEYEPVVEKKQFATANQKK